MREIIFDTETTGLRVEEGHRIIEIGAIEMVDRIPTGRTFHEYLKPGDVEVEEGAFGVHGISTEFLQDKPVFKDILPAFLEFFGEGSLIAHNAPFDMGFINMELGKVGEPPIDPQRVIDTLAIARRKFPGAKNSLDVLCGRFGISNAHRTLHGALLDSELLAEIYIELTGGKQVGFALEDEIVETALVQSSKTTITHAPQAQRPNPLIGRLTSAEREAHAAMVAKMEDKAVWNKWTDILKSE